MCLESLVGFYMKRMCMAFKRKMERGWRRIEMDSKGCKGVLRGKALVPNEGRLENRKNRMSLRMGGC